jgi:hypothetical protein
MILFKVEVQKQAMNQEWKQLTVHPTYYPSFKTVTYEFYGSNQLRIYGPALNFPSSDCELAA